MPKRKPTKSVKPTESKPSNGSERLYPVLSKQQFAAMVDQAKELIKADEEARKPKQGEH
jgi:hypothetical protein